MQSHENWLYLGCLQRDLILQLLCNELGGVKSHNMNGASLEMLERVNETKTKGFYANGHE